MGNLVQDLRHALRLLLQNPVFTLLSLLALALGIGANTIIFSAFNAVLLRPLPYQDPDRIVMLWNSYPQQGIKKFGVSYPNIVEWTEQNNVFEQIAPYQALSTTAFNLTGGSGAERIQGTFATGAFFDVLKVSPIKGITITAENEKKERYFEAVISYRLWQRYFGGDPNITDKTLQLNGRPFRIIGVMPDGFEFPSGSEMPAGAQFQAPTEIWIPLNLTPDAKADRSGRYLRAIARLKPGVTVRQAQEQMNAVTERLAEQFPDTYDDSQVSVVTMRDNQVGELRPAFRVLLGAVGFVLLIACANIANLSLSRAAARHKEFAIRAALGASRLRIVRQLLTESTLLAVIGGALGLLLAAAGSRALISLVPDSIPRLNQITIDARVLVFTLIISLVTGILFGMAPALHGSSPDLHEDVKEGGRGLSAGSSQKRLRSVLIVFEVVVVFVLLIGAGLMLRSFRRLLDVPAGFNAGDALTARITLPASRYQGRKTGDFFHQLLDQLGSQPGVRAAAVARDLPLSGTDPRYFFGIEGRPVNTEADMVTYRHRIVSPDYFKVMGVALREGRVFTDYDDLNSQPVVIINDTVAKKYWPGEDPLGKAILTDGKIAAERCIVVGIVSDVRFGGLDADTDSETYFPYSQVPEQMMPRTIGSMAVVVGTTGKPAAFTDIVRRQVQSIDGDIPISSVLSVEQVLNNSLAPRRFNLLLLTGFALVALALAAIGIYGVVGYWVTQRTREIGIRMALGAKATDILKLMMFQAMTVVLIGTGIGLLAAVAIARLLPNMFASLLFGVKAGDPITFAGVAILLTGTAFLACYLSARRATRVEPTMALRYE